MSKSLNSCNFTGYLAADPKLHTFDNGDTVANLRLAIANQKKVDGEWTDAAIFVDVKAYGKQAEAIAQYLAKGSFIAVSGRLAEPRSWQGDDGATRFTMVIDSAQVTFGPKGGESNGGGSHQSRSAAAPAAASAGGNMFDGGDEDIPF
jgi:single-strand DNA-binding protein